MSDYARANTGGATHFGDKDALTTGDSDKVIVGAQFDSEFNAVLTAVNSKYDSSDIASEVVTEAETSNATLVTPLRLGAWADDNAGIVGELRELADPGADRIFFWDDGESADSNVAFLTVGNGLEIGTTTLGIADAAAGAGLTASSGVLAVGGGAGITANADDVALTDAAATTTNPVDITSGAVSLDITALDQLTAAGIAGADEMVIDDGGTPKALRWQDFGIPQTDDTSTTPLSAADLTYANRWFNCNNASAISAVIPANSSVAYPVGTVLAFHQRGAGQVTVTVTTDTLRAPFGAATAVQYATIFATKIGTTEWTMSGDTSS